MKTSQTLRGRGLLLMTALVGAVALVFVGTATPAASIVLTPASSTLTTGQSVTLTATFGPDQNITFTVNSGPNQGKSSQSVTDNNGQARFTYSSSQVGTDHVTASIPSGLTSNDATVTWNAPVLPKTDAQLTLSAPSIARVGEKATWSATITNAGPDTATGVSFQATAPAGGTLVSASASQGNGCTGATCQIGTLANGASATVTLVYTLGQAGSVTLSAAVQADYDTNAGNNSASSTVTVLEPNQPPPPPPPPSQPGTFNAIPTGTVLVNGATEPADQPFVFHSGDTVDVTNGVITLTVNDGTTGNFSATQPTARRSLSHATAGLPATFTIQQASTGGTPTLTLTGGDFSVCNSPRRSAASSKPIRALWGSAKGHFTTSGKLAAATVRGTIWLVEDRCDGTLTQVVEGVVSVFDSVRKKTVTVNAGSSYLATARIALKVPAQSPAQIAKRGLLYGGRVYKTKAAFTARLKVIGYTWAEFAKQYPKLAAALAKRR